MPINNNLAFYSQLYFVSLQTDDGGGTSGRSSRGSDDDKLDRFLRIRLQRPHKPCGSGDSSTHAVSSNLCKYNVTYHFVRPLYCDYTC